MASRSEVLGDGTIGGEEPLRMSWGLEALHAPLPLVGRLVRVLGAIIEVAMLPMFHAGQDLPFGSGIAFQLIGDHHMGHIPQAFQ